MNNKRYKHIILFSIITILFLVTYNIVMSVNGVHKSVGDDFSFKAYEVNKENRGATFKEDSSGYYLMRAGSNKKSIGNFTFKKDFNVTMSFDKPDGEEKNQIPKLKVEIIRKKARLSLFLVAVDSEQGLSFSVKKDDRVKITVGGSGHSSLYISTGVPFFFFVVPLLWSLFLILLYYKGYLFTVVNSYIIFLLLLIGENLNFGRLNFNNVYVYMLLMFSITFVQVLIYQYTSSLKKFKVATIVSVLISITVYLVPLLFAIYAFNFDFAVTEDALYAVFQTNSSESSEYISDYISIKYIFLLVILPVVIALGYYKQEKNSHLKLDTSYLIFFILVLSSVIITGVDKLKLPSFVSKHYSKYYEELELFREVQAKRKTGDIKFKALKEKIGETYVIVIGESLNKNHMGLYGYFRNTTPMMSAYSKSNELSVFTNTYSSHTHTVQVLTNALTEANQYNNKSYYKSLSIIDILNKADFDTYWVTNQSIYGAWDNAVSVIATSAKNVVSLNKSIGRQTRTQNYDGELIDKVKKILNETTNKNRVIFVHLMGSHGKYASRYPDENIVFSEKLEQGVFGSTACNNNLINAYDNTVVYNDYVVTSILKEIQQLQGANGVLYFSDHADDVISKLAHNSSKFTYDMIQIPMLLWFSDSYKLENQDVFSTLSKRKDKLFSNDLLYDTMIGIFGIESDRYNSKYDFTSENYNLNPSDALVLDGKKKYLHKDNDSYWKYKNARFLATEHLDDRVFPHRVNSIGKLNEIWNDGFRSFEVDVRFGDDNSDKFIVGHNKGVMGMDLKSFIKSVEYLDIKKIWLDFKNLTKNNYLLALDGLEELDKEFGLKGKVIIETSSKESFFKEFAYNGWHTSYYLHTRTIEGLLKGKKTTEMNKLSLKLKNQIQEQNLSAVSFDDRLYPFVKKYLEPKISNTIVYHTWYGPSLSDPKFEHALSNDIIFKDYRVKTLLCNYKSKFNL